MSEKQSNKERLKAITDGIEAEIQKLFQSDRYLQYLTVMSRFHRYSMNNTMLIYMQKPDASLVAGFSRWKNQFGRHVKRGEKGITVIAPTPYKKKIEQEKLDPDTKLPLLDEDGNPIIEERTIQIPLYKPVKVFDVAQTEGKPLPTLAATLTGDVERYEVFMEALRRSSPVPIVFQEISDSTDGYFNLTEQSITIRKGMSEVQTVCAAIHEIAHSMLHNTDIPIPENARTYQEVTLFDQPALFDNGRVQRNEIPDGLFRYELRGADDDPGEPICVEESVLVNHAGTVLTLKPLIFPEEGRLMLTEESGLNFSGGILSAQEFLRDNRKDRATKEVEAESISYAVCQYYGIETGENSLGYIASWSKGKELKELRASLETINKTSSKLISDIDRNYGEICKERGIEQVERREREPERTENLLPDPAVPLRVMVQYGYTGDDMLPLSKDRALELSERDITVYLLYRDNSEAMALDDREIIEHDGLFGLTREDWEAVKADIPLRDVEKRFMGNPEDGILIYQLRESAPAELRFTPYDNLREAPSADNYTAVYTQPLYDGGSKGEVLEKTYEQFNLHHPADFIGHSLSVSDIVAIKRGAEVSYHYCDSFGFKELADFRPENYLKAAEMAVEDDYGMIDGIINNGPKQPTVAELEAQVKDGKPISLMELASATKRERQKESVATKLKNPPKQTRKKPEQTKQARKKSAEREL